MKQLLTFCGLSHDSQGVLAAIDQLALMGVELFLDGGLGIPHLGVSPELRVTAFTDSEHRNVPNSFHDPKITLWHIKESNASCAAGV
ncbi:MAG: hypothetical protein DMG70_14530 [Acidobacteria bacterium]|nr:MAG: hypothetical protein DMG70_14530 [Acidobacteriota bacterium]PYY06517.1 MAG: hypothetical protein DMG69_22945 [Acidobacteriota bacterium]